MEGGLLYHIMAWWFLVCIGMYRIYSATRNYLIKSPNCYYSAKPYHPLSCFSSYSSSSSSNWMMMLRHLEVYVVIACLIIALIHQLILSSESDPLLKGGVHPFTSLQSAAVIFLFLLLSFSLLLLPPLSTDLVFALASSFFYLHYSSSSSSSSSGLQSECDSLSGRVSALSSLLCLALACFPRLYVAEVGLGASICLQGQWALQTGLSLHADAFIPLGCHKLLDVASGIQGSTKCDLDESNIRAVALLDLMFVVHVVVVVVIVIVIYVVIARNNNVAVGATNTITNSRRFGGSYEALPTTTTATGVVAPSSGVGNVTAAADSSHIQMKAMTGTQA